MGTVSRLNATDEIRARRAFNGSNFYGVEHAKSYTYPGHLPAEWVERFKADRPTYVVYSYATPIGWVAENGTAVVPDVSYSVTTSAHQSVTAVALLGRGSRRTMLAVRPLHVIADEIERDWSARGSGVNYAARPYLDAMKSLDTLGDSFLDDTARDVVAYFLSNAKAWRGDVAKRVKAELRDMQRCQS